MENQGQQQETVHATVVNNANQSNSSNPGAGQNNIPGAVGVMILGICAIATFLAYGLGGIICGIIARSKAKKAMALYNTNPGMYKQGQYSMIKTGKTLGTIGFWGGIAVFAIVLFVIIAAIIANA